MWIVFEGNILSEIMTTYFPFALPMFAFAIFICKMGCFLNKNEIQFFELLVATFDQYEYFDFVGALDVSRAKWLIYCWCVTLTWVMLLCNVNAKSLLWIICAYEHGGKVFFLLRWQVVRPLCQALQSKLVCTQMTTIHKNDKERKHSQFLPCFLYVLTKLQP